MPRRRRVPKSVDTAYFTDVSPLWVPPGRQEIDDRFREAILLLAEWAGPQWYVNENSNFFLIRDLLIRLVNNLSNFDWQKDKLRFSDRKRSLRNSLKFRSAVENLASISDNGLNISSKHIILLKIFNAFSNSKHLEITIGDGWKSLLEALNAGNEFLDYDREAPFRFGPIEYPSLPKQLPSHLTVVGVAMADMVSTHRIAMGDKPRLSYPRKPVCSNDMPWKSFLLFLHAAFPDDLIDESSLQKNTLNLQRQDVMLHLVR